MKSDKKRNKGRRVGGHRRKKRNTKKKVTSNSTSQVMSTSSSSNNNTSVSASTSKQIGKRHDIVSAKGFQELLTFFSTANVQISGEKEPFVDHKDSSCRVDDSLLKHHQKSASASQIRISEPTLINEVENMISIKGVKGNVIKPKTLRSVTKDLMIDTSSLDIQGNKTPDPSTDSELSKVTSVSDDNVLYNRILPSPASDLISTERASQDNHEFQAKILSIISCLDPPQENIVDMWKLRELALSRGGLVSAEIRRAAWPKLAGIHKSLELADIMNKKYHDDITIFDMVDQDEQDVVMRDIGRSVWHNEIQLKRKTDYNDDASLPFNPNPTQRVLCDSIGFNFSDRSNTLNEECRLPNPSKRSASSREKEEQSSLVSVILSVLQHSAGSLHYYQGFHDLSALVVINMENLGLASCVLQKIGSSHLRDAMSNDFTNVMSLIRMTLFPLIALLDTELHDFLVMSEVEPFFCLSWIITWFSHDVRDLLRASRLFDAFIAAHPLFPMYMSTAMVLHPQNRLLLMSTDCEFAAIHTALAKLASSIPPKFEGLGHEYDEYLIETAIQIMGEVPPKRLKMLVKYYRKGSLRSLSDTVSSIHAFATPPMWCYSAAAPTERVLSEEGKMLRKIPRRIHAIRKKSSAKEESKHCAITTHMRQEISCPKPSAEYKPSPLKYRKALIASGMKHVYIKPKTRRKRNIIICSSAAIAFLSALAFINDSFDISKKLAIEKEILFEDAIKSSDDDMHLIQKNVDKLEKSFKEVAKTSNDEDLLVQKNVFKLETKSIGESPEMCDIFDGFCNIQEGSPTINEIRELSGDISINTQKNTIISDLLEEEIALGREEFFEEAALATDEVDILDNTLVDTPIISKISGKSQQNLLKEQKEMLRKRDKPRWVKALLTELHGDAEIVYL